MQVFDKSNGIQRVCEALFSHDQVTARHIAHAEYPFATQNPNLENIPCYSQPRCF
jgi:hypothetical protein